MGDRTKHDALGAGVVRRGGLTRLVGRQLATLALLALAAFLLRERIAGLDLAEIGAALRGVSAAQWLGAALFTGVSFWALGRYDAVVHRLFETPITPRAAVASGATAIAVSQTVGLGTVTGTLVRWRLLPGLTLAAAARVSIFVSVSFFAAWAVLAAVALLLVPLPLPGARIAAGLVLALALGLALLSLLQPRWLPRAIGLPPLRAMGVFLGLTLLDTLAAGTALWLLLPSGLDLAAPPLLAAYLLALGAGLVLTTPGGVGPFELALIALLPGVGAEPLLGAVIAFRLVYYALPALIGGLVLLRGPRPRGAAAPAGLRLARAGPAQERPHLLDAVIDQAPRAEAALLRHGRLALLEDAQGRPLALAAATGQSLVLLGDPLAVAPDRAGLLDAATARARAGWRAPVLYKAGARLAAVARARGWRVSPVAREAWLDPRAFRTDSPARRQLRRKLRKAQAAGVRIEEAGPGERLPRGEMARIAAAWSRARGGDRGFSMGSWSPEALDWARVLLARDDAGRLLGFVTVHFNPQEHALDLMRLAPDAPDGTMHRLVCAAIEAAGRAGVARFSLAAVPAPASADDPAPLRWLRARLRTAAGGPGLQQFKAAFGPRWQTLYIAAPGRMALALGALDILREITRGGQRGRAHDLHAA